MKKITWLVPLIGFVLLALVYKAVGVKLTLTSVGIYFLGFLVGRMISQLVIK